MANIHYNILVKGKVQGVWFRKFTRNKAMELNIKGFAKNTFDGDVYIEIEGVQKDIDKFTKWLYSGSPLSVVTDVQIEKGTLKRYGEFLIRY